MICAMNLKYFSIIEPIQSKLIQMQFHKLNLPYIFPWSENIRTNEQLFHELLALHNPTYIYRSWTKWYCATWTYPMAGDENFRTSCDTWVLNHTGGVNYNVIWFNNMVSKMAESWPQIHMFKTLLQHLIVAVTYPMFYTNFNNTKNIDM